MPDAVARTPRSALRAAGVVAFVLSLGATGLLYGTLCLGDDGHVAIEFAAAGGCLDGAIGEGAASHHAAPALQPPGDCGPCTDLTSPVGRGLPAAKSASADLALAAHAAHAPRDPFPAAPHGGPTAVRRPDPLATLRSVVSRC